MIESEHNSTTTRPGLKNPYESGFNVRTSEDSIAMVRAEVELAYRRFGSGRENGLAYQSAVGFVNSPERLQANAQMSLEIALQLWSPENDNLLGAWGAYASAMKPHWEERRGYRW